MACAIDLEDWDLPSLPRVALEIIALVQDPDVDLQTLSRKIELDAGLAGRMLKLANSSLFGLSRPATSVKQALVILGLRTAKLTALSFTLLPAFPTDDTDAELLKMCWRRILTNAMACRLLAPSFEIDAEQAFLVGLLQDIGVIVLANKDTVKYLEITNLRAEENAPSLCKLEKERFGVDHAAIAAYLLRSWNVPENLALAVETHHSQSSEQSPNELTFLLSIAERMTDFLNYPTISNLEALMVSKEHFGPNGSMLDQFVQKLELQVKELAGMLDLQLPEGETYEDVIRRADGGVSGHCHAPGERSSRPGADRACHRQTAAVGSVSALY